MKNIKQDKVIIHFSSDDFWNSNPHSRFHIVNGFYELEYKILWINTIGTRFPSIKKKNFLLRLQRKLKSIFKSLHEVKNNYYIFTPIVFPVFKSYNLFTTLNDFLLKIQFYFLYKKLGIQNPILFYTTPIYASLIKIIKYNKLIYYYSDKYTEYRELTKDNKLYLEYLDELLYKNADSVYCASKKIYESIFAKRKKSVYYLPHAVDFYHFNNKDISIPKNLSMIRKPIIGYYGTLTDSNDWELIKFCAINKPEYSFVFIGRKDFNDKELEKLSNVHFLGKIDYELLPSYATYFDVCIMFWTRREWIKNSSPLKLKEYLSLGRPVVSTLIEELELKYSNIVYISKSKEEFLNNLIYAVENDSSERIIKGIEIVKNDNWISISKLIVQGMLIND